MKKLLSLLLCLCLALSLAACTETPAPTDPPTEAPTTAPTVPLTEPPTEPPMTADVLYTKIQQAMQDAVATKASMDISFSISYTEGEGDTATTTEVSYKMIVDGVVSTDPFGSYILSSVEVGTDGFSMDLTVDMYIVEEEDQVVMYMKAFDTWSRVESGMTVEEFMNSGEMSEVSTDKVWSADTVLSDMVLEEKTQILDGKEVYVLHATIRADGSADALRELGVELENTEDLAMPVTYYVDAKTYTIRQMVAGMEIMSDLLADAMAESLLGAGGDPDDLTIEFPDAVYTVDYGPQEIPPIPQEALDYIANNSESSLGDEEIFPVEGQATDMGDGTFVLPCGSEAIGITCPDGWSGMVCSKNNIWIYAEDDTQYADIYYLADDTEDDIRDQIQLDTDGLKDMDIFLSSGEGPAYEGYTTAVVMGVEESYCYAWTEMGEGYLMVILADYTAEPDFETLLHDFMAMISPYTGEFVRPEPLLNCGNQQFLLTCPDGYSMDYNNETNLMFATEDYSICGDFYYFDEYSREDALDNADFMAAFLDSLETLISQGDGPAIEGYETWKVIGTEQSYYYAWREAGDGWLVLQVYDYTGGDNAEELLAMFLDCISAE